MERYSGGSTTGGEVTQQAKQQGQQLAQQARQQASDLASRGGEQVKSQLANQKHDASQRLTPITVALRETAQQLRKQGQAPVAGYADKTSDQVERFSGYLRETEVDEMVEQARGFARSRPALYLGSAVALGFLGARFLKSSSQGASAGGSSDGGYGAGTSSAEISQGTRETATALPPETGAGSPTPSRTPTTTTGEPLHGGYVSETPRDV